MNKTPSFRDLENLSVYLDDQLSMADRARLEARFGSEPWLVNTLKELKQARVLMKNTPRKHVPRNFYLTPKMVGIRPPLPRSFPVFRLASITTAIILFLTFAVNFLNPIAAAPSVALAPYGIGGGCDSSIPGNCGDQAEVYPPIVGFGGEPKGSPSAEPPTTMSVAPVAPGTTTPEPTSESSSRTMEQPTEATSLFPTEAPSMVKPAVEKNESQPILNILQIGLIILFLTFAGIALIIRKISISKWQKRQ